MVDVIDREKKGANRFSDWPIVLRGIFFGGRSSPARPVTSLTVAHVTFDEDLKVRYGVRNGLTAETFRLLAFSLVPRALP